MNNYSKQAINERLFSKNTNKPTVTLLSEEKVKVNLDYLAEFLEDNKEVVKVQKVKRRGSMNRSLQETLGDFSTPIYFE